MTWPETENIEFYIFTLRRRKKNLNCVRKIQNKRMSNR